MASPVSPPSPHPNSLPPPRMLATIPPRKLAMICEVYARLGLRPGQAVHLLRRQGVIVPFTVAAQQLAAARRRNLLKLVAP